MPFHLTTTETIVAAIIIFVVVAIAVGIYLKYRKTRTLAFRKRFGSEYDRAVLEHGTAHKAESNLADRQTRVQALKIRDVGELERARFIAEWSTVQSRFVDHPKAAVTEADDLIAALLEARGYPKNNFEQRAADVSVTYPRVMENYRVAHDIAVGRGQVEPTTEDLRTAMIQYRGIFDELIQTRSSQDARSAA